MQSDTTAQPPAVDAPQKPPVPGAAPDSELNDGDATPPTNRKTRPRTATTTSEIDTTLNHPGSVRINVEGAFIVDQDGGSPTSAAAAGNGRSVSPSYHETKDIRLPNHTAVVSHVAVDVGPCPWLCRDRAYGLRDTFPPCLHCNCCSGFVGSWRPFVTLGNMARDWRKGRGRKYKVHCTDAGAFLC
jgi:hypothetical protein